jgi:hypothetical protein
MPRAAPLVVIRRSRRDNEKIPDSFVPIAFNHSSYPTAAPNHSHAVADPSTVTGPGLRSNSFECQESFLCWHRDLLSDAAGSLPAVTVRFCRVRNQGPGKPSSRMVLGTRTRRLLSLSFSGSLQWHPPLKVGGQWRRRPDRRSVAQERRSGDPPGSVGGRGGVEMSLWPIGRRRTRSGGRSPAWPGRRAGLHERLRFGAREPPAHAAHDRRGASRRAFVGCGGLAGEASRVQSPHRGEIPGAASRVSCGSVRRRLRGRPRRWARTLPAVGSGPVGYGRSVVYLATRFLKHVVYLAPRFLGIFSAARSYPLASGRHDLAAWCLTGIKRQR